MRWVLFYAILIGVCGVARAQCVNIYGVVTDAYSGKPVAGVLINQKMKGKSQELVKTLSTGKFQISLPCDAEGITLEANGYRPLHMPMNLMGQQSGSQFYVPVKMVQIDKQASDKPYFQQQQQFVSLKDQLGNAVRKTTRVFEVLDALTGAYVGAELCLFYTKSGKKDCRTISKEQPRYQVDFTDTDIVAIEVRAKGYQDYFGNLIMDELGDKMGKYQIRLSAQFNLLSVTVNAGREKVECQLAGSKSVALTTQDGLHFYSEIPETGVYQLVVKTLDGVILHSKTLTTSRGMNLYGVHVRPNTVAKKPSPKLSVEAFPIESKLRTIYFDRSEYKLRAESKPVLDTVASWLGQNPSGYLTIVGHTDNVGDSKLNLTLSEYRARLAYHFLEERGADVNRITYIGKGSTSPVAPNDIEANKEKNRRVEIQLLNKP